MNLKKGRLLKFLISIFAVFEISSAQATNWETGKVQAGGATIYSKSSEQSGVLGKYPEGTSLRVFKENRNGFYAIYLSKPWKGTQYVWIPVQNIGFDSNDSAKRSLASVEASSDGDKEANPEKSHSSSDSSKKKFTLIPGLGVTSLNYVQTGVSAFSEILMTVKVGFNYRFNEEWSLAGNSFYNFLTLKPSDTGVDAKSLAGNLRVGYLLTPSDPDIKFSVFMGWYFITIYSVTLPYGYVNVQGPQLFPTVSLKTAENQNISVYGKYSPSMVSVGFASTNYEIAFGTAYTIGNFGISLDFAHLSLILQDGSGIKSTSYSAGLSYKF